MKEFPVEKIESTIRLPKDLGTQKVMISGKPRGLGAVGMKKSVMPTLSITEDYHTVIVRGIVRAGKAQPPYLLPVTFGGGLVVRLASDPGTAPPTPVVPVTPPKTTAPPAPTK